MVMTMMMKKGSIRRWVSFGRDVVVYKTKVEWRPAKEWAMNIL
jgi:hypothetical protein